MAVRFLIADDSGPLRKALKTIIEEHPDWKVCGEAANGSEAVVLAKELNPDIIVLDLTMPLMNGLEAARQIEHILPSTPMLLFTMYLTPAVIAEAQHAGFGAAISKNMSANLASGRSLGVPCLLKRSSPIVLRYRTAGPGSVAAVDLPPALLQFCEQVPLFAARLFSASRTIRLT